jgi:hypothetical protein
MTMTHVQTRGERSSRPERLASVDHAPTIIDSQRNPDAVVRRGCDVRPTGM